MITVSEFACLTEPQTLSREIYLNAHFIKGGFRRLTGVECDCWEAGQHIPIRSDASLYLEVASTLKKRGHAN